MPLVQYLHAEASQVRRFQVGDVVQCGPVGAVWIIQSRVESGDQVRFTLEPVDPHDVLLSAWVHELPMPPR